MIRNLVLTTISTAVWFAIMWGVWLTYFETNNLEVKESAAWSMDGIPKTRFKPGEKFIAHRHICVSKSRPGDFTIEIHGGPNNSIVVVSNGRLGQVAAGCSDRNVVTQIPESLTPGSYALRAFTVYEINPFRTIRAELPPIHFLVAP